ncbi:A/G-specific adenine glycosylase [Vagococcus sp. CY52-2]|uniref:A/G-specific adenine glycosylase n=1 Tax=Vagococcus sp. CY52-2 TaxID=2925838 RepID=UPI001F55C3C8|nr:A/G-specific adenine glycosylase [Vagococcus sp. CY52-2]UNM89979.1 A/G-specific adenine glycosylase [Vagococcus sp. CY52-2]
MSKEITWTQEKTASFQEDLLTWYRLEKRDLPWRESTDPYRVWVSEIMLQQTQVVTVIPYFNRFMEWFPTIEALANANEDKLLKAWEGLGYYSRVRNMQHAAREIVATFDGKMPNKIEDILSLKGIGPYTGGAIGSIAFSLPEPAIDGNVMRVYSRLFCLADDIALPKTRKVFDRYVRDTMSQSEPGDFNQALMDLGATICTPTKPSCDTCPIQAYCEAKQTNTISKYPVKKKKEKATPLYYVADILQNDTGAFLLEKRPSDGLLADMWTFPMREVTKKDYDRFSKIYDSQDVLTGVVAEQLSLYDEADNVKGKKLLGIVTHIFSHRKWHILVVQDEIKGLNNTHLTNQEWSYLDEFPQYVFPKPQQKMVELLKKSMNN